MARDMTHPPEAWDIYLKGLQQKSKSWLIEAILEANWQLMRYYFQYGINMPERVYKKSLKSLSVNELAQIALEQTRQHKMCSLNGLEFFVDPSGIYRIKLLNVK
jgi:hypothetical protein